MRKTHKQRRCAGPLGVLALSLWLSAAAGSVEDDLGISVDLPERPQRIVSLAPSNTEVLFALGLGDLLVGVTEYCNFPPAAQEIQKVAGYSSISAEQVLAVKPDLVVAARGNQLEGLETLRRMGIPVFALDVQSVDQLLSATQRLGRLTGRESAAAALRQEWQARVDRVQTAVDSLAPRPRVMWGSWGGPVYTAGKGSMVDDVFRLSGGDNVGRAAPGRWPQVGLETIVSWAPEVIITTLMSGDEAPAETMPEEIARLRTTEGWKTLPAVRNGRVHYLEPDLLMRAGPRMIDAIEQVAALLHPGAFPRP